MEEIRIYKIENAYIVESDKERYGVKNKEDILEVVAKMLKIKVQTQQPVEEANQEEDNVPKRRRSK